MSELNILLLRRRKTHWGGKQTEALLPAVCWSCCRCWQNEFCCENHHPSDDIKPAALENESLDEERSDNIELRTSSCELACESDSGEDDNCDDAEYLHHPLI